MQSLPPFSLLFSRPGWPPARIAIGVRSGNAVSHGPCSPSTPVLCPVKKHSGNLPPNGSAWHNPSRRQASRSRNPGAASCVSDVTSPGLDVLDERRSPAHVPWNLLSAPAGLLCR